MVEGELSVTIESEEGERARWPLLLVAGEIDIQTSPLLQEQLTKVLETGVSSVSVDLSDVSFLDSTGLSVLIAGLKRCQEAGGELHLVAPRPNVLRVLEITGLTESFHLKPGGTGEPAA